LRRQQSLPVPRYTQGKTQLWPRWDGRNLPKIQQPRQPEPSTINEKTIADFARVVEQAGILERESVRPPQ
jgi:hypothetical protein